jgi:hypothetical protein
MAGGEKRHMDGFDDREVVILIHGTGASEPDPVNPMWWQPESAFAGDLRERLGPRFDVGQSPESAPFCWSGRNSERDRRTGAAVLLRRLRKLEAKGIRYHLVGHSHGGSIIWHMLTRATARGINMNGLRSWTSVGTPFLEFAPLWHGILTFVAAAFFLAIIGVYLVGIYGTGSFSAGIQAFWSRGTFEDIRWQDVPAFGKWLFIVQFTIVALVTVYLTVASVRWVGRWINYRLRRTSEALAARRYRSRWLALWHRYDEPINGLSATLVSPVWFAPRGTTPKSHWLARTLWWPWNRLIAPTIDQYVWKLTMARLQGGDIWGLSLVDAAAAPRALRPGWPHLIDPIAQDMSKSAGDRAATTAGELRQRLAELRAAGEGREAVQQLATAISWSEVLHTCYFDHAPVRDLIACQVLRNQSRAQAAPAAQDATSASMKWLSEDHQPAVVRLPKPFRPLQLALTRVVAILTLAVVIGLGLLSTYVAYVRDNSGKWQISQLAKNAISGKLTADASSQTSTEGGLALVGDVHARLKAIAEVENLEDVFRQFPDAITRVMAAQRFAYALGHAGHFDEVEKLVETLAVLERADAIEDLTIGATAVRAYALAGGLAAGLQAQPKTSFVQDTIRGLQHLKRSALVPSQEMLKLLTVSLGPLKRWGPPGAALEHVNDVAEFLRGVAQRDCKEFLHWASVVPMEDLPDDMASSKTQCERLPPKRFTETSLDLLMANESYKDAAELIAQGVPRSAAEPDHTAALVDHPWRLLAYGQILQARGEKDAAERITLYFLRRTETSLWSSSPLEIMMSSRALGQLCTRLNLKSEANSLAVMMRATAEQNPPDMALRLIVATILYREIQSVDDAKRTLQTAFDAARKHADPNERVLLTLFLSQFAKEMDTYSIARAALSVLTDQGLASVKLRENPATDVLIELATQDAQDGKFRLARRTAELAGEPTPGFYPSVRAHGGVLEGYARILDMFIQQRHPELAKIYGMDHSDQWPSVAKIHSVRSSLQRPK